MTAIDPKNKVTENPVLILTASAKAVSGGMERFNFVKIDGTLPAAGALAAGATNADSSEGENIPVTAVGVAIVRAGAAVAEMAEVEGDAQGRAIPLASGKRNGIALAAATQAGDLIPVLLK